MSRRWCGDVVKKVIVMWSGPKRTATLLVFDAGGSKCGQGDDSSNGGEYGGGGKGGEVIKVGRVGKVVNEGNAVQVNGAMKAKEGMEVVVVSFDSPVDN